MKPTIPYMSAPGAVAKILEKIKEASTPEIFSYDFLATKLGFKGGNYRTFVSWGKKLGLLNSNGSPTQLYKQFRNPTTSGTSLAAAIKIGYAELYSRNEYCHDLDKKAFKSLVMEATGEAHDSRKVEMIVSTFFNAKSLANFDDKHSKGQKENIIVPQTSAQKKQIIESPKTNKLNLGLNYTINLVLPKTDDPSIYNAIFKSLKENLLNES